MMIKKTLSLTTIAVMFAGVPLMASAQDAGFYAGVAVGQSKAKDACDGIGGVGVACDDKDTAWKIFGGYQINKNFGVELGYVNLGEASATATAAGLTGAVSIDTKAFELVGVGTLPVSEKFSLYAKAGLFRWDADGTVVVSGVGSASASEKGTDLTFGVGVKYDFTKNIGARLEWQRYNDVADGNFAGLSSTGSDVDLLSVGVVFKF